MTSARQNPLPPLPHLALFSDKKLQAYIPIPPGQLPVPAVLV